MLCHVGVQGAPFGRGECVLPELETLVITTFRRVTDELTLR